MMRKDTCVSSVHGSVLGVPETLDIVPQYIREKKILSFNDPNEDVSA